VLRFFIPDVPAQVRHGFRHPRAYDARDGAVTLTFTVNGHCWMAALRAARRTALRADAAGNATRQRDQLVGIDPDPVWVSKADGGRLGFIFSRAGFTE
jgi:hypothetical protein